MHRYTLYLIDERRPGLRSRISEHPTYRDHPHDIITDEPIPTDGYVVLDGGGRMVLEVGEVIDDEVFVRPTERRNVIPFRNAADEEADA